MKEPKNIRIILVPVEQMERKDMENIECSSFKSRAQIVNALFHTRALYMQEKSFELRPLIMTADEFRDVSGKKVKDAFNGAMLNVRKRNSTQCYGLSEFVDEFNNQEFGGKTNKYWIGYVKLK